MVYSEWADFSTLRRRSVCPNVAPILVSPLDGTVFQPGPISCCRCLALAPCVIRQALFFDYSANPVSYVNPALLSYGLYGVRMISARAALLQAGNVLSEAALDKYSFVRNAYLQRRAYFSGAPNRNGPPRDEDEGASSSGSVAAPPAEQHIPSQQMIPPHIMPQIHLGW